MKTKILILLSSLSLFSVNSFAEEVKSKRLDFEKLLEPGAGEDGSTSVTINYKRGTSNILHNEGLSGVDNKILNKESSISRNTVSVEMSQEFFNRSYISLSLGLRAGISRGSDQQVEEEQSVNFEDEHKGYHYGAGGSLNLNTEGYGMRIQPFVSGYYIVSDEEYNFSNFINNINDPDTYNIDYRLENESIEASLGVRLYNNYSNLMSFFSINYTDSVNTSSSVSASRNGATVELDNASTVGRDGLGFTIGAGINF